LRCLQDFVVVNKFAIFLTSRIKKNSNLLL
jgi:hypothetical protein